MSNQTTTNLSDLLQDQINYYIDQLVDLKARYQSGLHINWDGETIYAPSLTLREFNEQFEELNDKLLELQLHQARL